VSFHILRSLMVLVLSCLTVPALSQNSSPGSQPTGLKEGLFQCAAWARATTRVETIQDLDTWLRGQHRDTVTDDPVQVAETVKVPYLMGLQYGYLTALEGVYRLLNRKSGQDPEKEFPSTWPTLLSPRSGLTWTNFETAIDAFCSNADHSDEDVAEAAITILNVENARPAQFGPDQRALFSLATVALSIKSIGDRGLWLGRQLLIGCGSSRQACPRPHVLCLGSSARIPIAWL